LGEDAFHFLVVAGDFEPSGVVLEQLLVGTLVVGVARCVIGDLGFGLALVSGLGQVDGGALDGN